MALLRLLRKDEIMVLVDREGIAPIRNLDYKYVTRF